MADQQKRNTSSNRPGGNPGPYIDPSPGDTPEETDPIVARRRDQDNKRGRSDTAAGQDQNRVGGGASRGRGPRRTQDSETGSTDAEPDGNRDNPGRSSGDQR